MLTNNTTMGFREKMIWSLDSKVLQIINASSGSPRFDWFIGDSFVTGTPFLYWNIPFSKASYYIKEAFFLGLDVYVNPYLEEEAIKGFQSPPIKEDADALLYSFIIRPHGKDITVNWIQRK